MGKYEFNRTLWIGPGSCIFSEMDCSFAMGYLDDIIIFSKTEEEHLQHLEEIFDRLRFTVP